METEYLKPVYVRNHSTGRTTTGRMHARHKAETTNIQMSSHPPQRQRRTCQRENFKKINITRIDVSTQDRKMKMSAYKTILIWETHTKRSLLVELSKATEGPGRATYMAWGGGETVVLNITREPGIPKLVCNTGNGQPENHHEKETR